MYEYISGKVVQKEPTFAVIDANGIGYHLRISLQTYSLLPENQAFKLYTYLHIKEDAHTLYGFADLEERKMFLLLLSVQGVGTNTALVMLSSLSLAELKEGILYEKVNIIKGVKGIGLKTAQKIILELKDKIGKTLSSVPLNHTFSTVSVAEEALLALTTLGIARNVAEKSVEQILKKSQNPLTVEEIIKLALSHG